MGKSIHGTIICFLLAIAVTLTLGLKAVVAKKSCLHYSVWWNLVTSSISAEKNHLKLIKCFFSQCFMLPIAPICPGEAFGSFRMGKEDFNSQLDHCWCSQSEQLQFWVIKVFPSPPPPSLRIPEAFSG